jgi:hypothetical protein
VLPVGTYVPLYDPANLADAPKLDLEAHRFRSPDDAVDWVRRDITIPTRTFPDVWHVDRDGAIKCWYRASSLDGIAGWADNPYGLLRSRWEGTASTGCTRNWLIFEPRTLHREAVPPSEADAEAFVLVRKALLPVGVHLIDLVITDDQFHVWSMHELEAPGTPYPLVGDDD